MRTLKRPWSRVKRDCGRKIGVFTDLREQAPAPFCESFGLKTNQLDQAHEHHSFPGGMVALMTHRAAPPGVNEESPADHRAFERKQWLRGDSFAFLYQSGKELWATELWG